MPLALLLRETSNALERGVTGLAGWAQLVELEALLVARARSAFLVHWFGPRLPLQGSRLRIAVVNLDELRARFLDVRAATSRPDADGLDLGPPVAALLGTAVGMVLNPFLIIPIALWASFTALGRIALSLLAGKWKWLAVVLGPVVAPIVGPAAVLVLAPLLLAYALGLSPLLLLGDARVVADLYVLLVAVGGLVPPFVEFLETLTGQWDSIFGPIVRISELLFIFLAEGTMPAPPGAGVEIVYGPVLAAFLPLAKRMTLLMPLLFDTLGLFVFALGPLLKPLAIILPAFLDFVDAVLTAIGTAFGEVVDGLTRFFDRAESALAAVTAALTAEGTLMNTVSGVLTGLLSAATSLVTGRLPAVIEALADYGEDLERAIRELWKTDPSLRVLRGIQERLDFVTSFNLGNVLQLLLYDVFGRAYWEVRWLAEWARSEVMLGKPASASASTETPSSIPELPDFDEVTAKLPPPLTLEAVPRPYGPYPALEVPPELLTRESVFAAERRALRTELGPARAEEQRLRGPLFDVVARLLPPAVDSFVEQLRDVLTTLDRTLGPDERRPSEELPVRHLPAGSRVQPAVATLRIRVRTDDEAGASRWAASLRTALGAEIYALAP